MNSDAILAVGSDSRSGHRRNKAELFIANEWLEISPYPSESKLKPALQLKRNI